MSYFQPGARVTICSDAAGQHPRRIGLVKRMGVEAWRLGGTSEWYNLDGVRVGYGQPTCFARPYKEGDEAAILVEDKLVAVAQERELHRTRISRARANLERYTIPNYRERIQYFNKEIENKEYEINIFKRDIERYKSNVQDYENRIVAAQKEMEAIDLSLKEFDKETDSK